MKHLTAKGLRKVIEIETQEVLGSDKYISNFHHLSMMSVLSENVVFHDFYLLKLRFKNFSFFVTFLIDDDSNLLNKPITK
jgi:hypothetical protein